MLPFAFLWSTQELKSHWIISLQVPKIAVPLNTTKYNPSLDDNLTLISSFNKFPYPTQAELSWLTAASKHPEEQIKVWFTTQRLKQGISWSPEEVGIIVHKKHLKHSFSSLKCGFNVVYLHKEGISWFLKTKNNNGSRECIFWHFMFWNALYLLAFRFQIMGMISLGCILSLP